jgi:hypothetical protein
MGGPGSGRKVSIGNMFNPGINRVKQTTNAGDPGYDNVRENIDPHVRTKVIDTKEIIQAGVSYDLSTVGADSIWTSGSGFIYPISGIQIISGAGVISTGVISGTNVTTGSNPGHTHTIYASAGQVTTHVADTDIHFLSGAFTTHVAGDGSDHADVALNTAQVVIISGALAEVSGAQVLISGALAEVSGAHTSLSGAYYTHAADTSDPHGAVVTQTGMTVTTLSGATMTNTADSTASGAEVVRNILVGTESTPPTASDYIQGTVYLEYTA